MVTGWRFSVCAQIQLAFTQQIDQFESQREMRLALENGSHGKTNDILIIGHTKLNKTME